ncbi:MAG: large-conductance mechanosensitive channel protein MscL [Pseudomonadota bacterium]
MWKDFKEFAMRGNVVDMAVGIIIGAAFGAIVKSLVSDIIMPPLGMIISNADFSDLFVVLKQGAPVGPYASVALAAKAGAVTLNLGLFINVVINFFIVAFAVFMLVRGVNRLQKPKETPPAKTKDCPYCLMAIPVKAVKCGHCTADIKEQ